MLSVIVYLTAHKKQVLAVSFRSRHSQFLKKRLHVLEVANGEEFTATLAWVKPIGVCHVQRENIHRKGEGAVIEKDYP